MGPRMLTYRKPWQFRAIFVFGGLLGISLPFMAAFDMASHPPPNYSALPMAVLVFGGAGLLFLWLSGSDDIDFDLEQRTYHHVKGGPFFAKSRSGTTKDFWGVYVGQTQGKSAYYCVGVTWWGGQGNITLERFSSKMQAERFAESLMVQLELKQIMPPRTLRPSR